jgi:hypothetical protein
MRNLAMIAALAAGVLSATLTAEASTNCRFESGRWVHCGSSNVPGVTDGKIPDLKAPHANARPHPRCTAVSVAAGTTLWRCLPGTAEHLRNEGATLRPK